ncbi:MAG: hypothetical protein DRI48_11020 [Chloroflexi bacterium]|nr:MAG: hypothetical protein DRI48_11020 [Chloroflexota bacterium]
MRSLKSPLKVLVVAAALISSIFITLQRSSEVAHSQSPATECEYFTETGHWVCDEFLEYFNTRGGAEIFGYPRTKRFTDPERGLEVQYFQRARMELHPYNPEPYKVLLGLLVDELGYRFPKATDIPPNGPLHHYFAETGYVVSYAFLDYFREKGGLDIFGYPRSEFMYEEGYIVQYFQRARMEWHPEIVSGPQMRLTNIGDIYLERFNVPEEYIQPEEQESPAGIMIPPEVIVTQLNVSASVRNIITGREGTQTVFVYVTDQRQQPVQGALVSMVVNYQSGEQHYNFEPTNESGFSSRSFDILPALPGRKVVIDVAVTYNDLMATTQTFFLPWW